MNFPAGPRLRKRENWRAKSPSFCPESAGSDADMRRCTGFGLALMKHISDTACEATLACLYLSTSGLFLLSFFHFAEANPSNPAASFFSPEKQF